MKTKKLELCTNWVSSSQYIIQWKKTLLHSQMYRNENQDIGVLYEVFSSKYMQWEKNTGFILKCIELKDKLFEIS